jgi:hypothetical protein
MNYKLAMNKTDQIIRETAIELAEEKLRLSSPRMYGIPSIKIESIRLKYQLEFEERLKEFVGKIIVCKKQEEFKKLSCNNENVKHQPSLCRGNDNEYCAGCEWYY